MMDLMLGNAPDAFSCGEVYAWYRPWRARHLRIDCPCRSEHCPWTHLKDLPERAFHRGVVERLGVQFVIDSSKDLCWLLDSIAWAERAGMRVAIVVMWKHPVQLAYSHWKRGLSATHWRREFVSYYGKLLALGLPCVSVNLGCLIDNPSGNLQEICRQVGLDYFSNKERFWEKSHHHLFGSLGTRLQVEKGSSSIETSMDVSPAFLTHADAIKKQIDLDTRVKDILAALGRAEHVHSPLNGNSKPDRTLPMWYYVRRARQKLLRHRLRVAWRSAD